jgi:hypothetical protein
MDDGWLDLRVWAECYEDVQKTLQAVNNRVERGGVDATLFKYQLDSLAIAKDEFQKSLKKAYRHVVPVGIRNWQKESTGIGEHLLARLLGVIGHPVHALPHHWEPNPEFDPDKPAGDNNPKRVLVADEPLDRSLSQLWAYCGHGDPTRKRREGMSQEDALRLGNPRAKTLVYLLAESCMVTGKGKAHAYYRAVYDDARELYATRVSTDEDKWTDKRRHLAALRRVGKEILKDLWLADQQDHS